MTTTTHSTLTVADIAYVLEVLQQVQNLKYDATPAEMSRCSPVTLFAVVLAGTPEQCLRARHELRERFVKAKRARIEEITEDMIRAEADSCESRHAGEF